MIICIYSIYFFKNRSIINILQNRPVSTVEPDPDHGRFFKLQRKGVTILKMERDIFRHRNYEFGLLFFVQKNCKMVAVFSNFLQPFWQQKSDFWNWFQPLFSREKPSRFPLSNSYLLFKISKIFLKNPIKIGTSVLYLELWRWRISWCWIALNSWISVRHDFLARNYNIDSKEQDFNN